jgi:hypothetical protein
LGGVAINGRTVGSFCQPAGKHYVIAEMSEWEQHLENIDDEPFAFPICIIVRDIFFFSFLLIESTLKTHRKASSIATIVRDGQKNNRFNQQSQKTNEIITVNENHHEVLKSMSTGSASPSTRHRRLPGTRQAMNRMTRFPYSLDSYSSSPTQSYPRP